MKLEGIMKLQSRGLFDPVLEEALAAAASNLPDPELSKLHTICSDVMFRKGQYNDAVVYGRMAVEADDGNAEGYSCLGWAEYWLGMNESALQHLKKAVELAPDSAEYRYRVGSILHNAFGNLPEAEAEFSMAVEADPSHTLAWQQRGICRWSQGNREGAENDYRKGAMLGDPYCGYILRYYGYPLEAPMEKVALARDCRRQNDHGTAADLLKQALDQGMGAPEKQTEVRLELAECLSDMKLESEAETQYGLAIEEAPMNPFCHGERGLFHYNASRDCEAENDFRKALELAQDKSRYVFYLGRLYAVSGRPEEGLALLDPAIEEDPYDVALFHSRAICRVKLGMHEGAKEDFQRADFLGHRSAQRDRRQTYGDEYAIDFFAAGIEAGDQNNPGLAIEKFSRAADLFRRQSVHSGDRAWRYAANSLHNLGYYRHQAGELKEAVEDISKALEMTPHYKDAWISMGNVYDTMGSLDEALECYNRAIDLQPNDGRGYYSRGRILLAQKRFDEGAEDFSKAAMFYGRNDWKGDAYFNRARCHEGAGRISEAIEDYQQAVSHGIQQGMFESVRLREIHGIG